MYHPNIQEVVRRQLQSFDDYAAQVKTEKLANKMLIDNLFVQVVEAKAASAINEANTSANNAIIEKLDSINNKLNTTINPKELAKEVVKEVLNLY